MPRQSCDWHEGADLLQSDPQSWAIAKTVNAREGAASAVVYVRSASRVMAGRQRPSDLSSAYPRWRPEQSEQFLSSAFGVLGGSASCLTMMCGGKHRFSACCRRRRRSAALAGAFVVRADCFCRSPRCQRLQRDSQDLGEQAATFNCETLFHCVAINSGARKALDTGVGSPQRMSVAMPKDSRFHCGVLSHKHPHGADWRQPAAAWSRAVLMQVRRL